MRQARSRRTDGTERPTPGQAIEAAHRRQSRAFGSRPDRFSQLFARILRDEDGPTGLVTASGLTEEEHTELTRIAPEAHRGFRSELTDSLAKLRDLLAAAGDPFYTLSVVQDLNLLVPWGEYFEPTHAGLESRVELVAGLLATESRATRIDRPSPAAVQAVLDEVDHVLQVGLLFNLSMPRGADLDIATLRFTTTSRWMSVRGASFPSHGEELAAEIYGPIADWLMSRFGFDIQDVIKVGRASVDLIADRRTATAAAAREAANAEMLSEAAREPSDRAQAKAIQAALRTFEDGLRDGHVLTANQLCEKDPSLDHDRAQAVLAELSVAVGSLPPESYTGLYDQNPLRERPFLKFGGEYMLALPGSVTRDVDTLLESRVLAADPAFSRRRALVLDRLAVAYLSRLLPGSTGYTNLFYEGNELDGLVLFDTLAVVVEGKGSSISVQAQRGDTVRLGRDIEDAVEDAWRQGARARAYLLAAEESVFLDEHGVEILRVPAGTIRTVIIINPTMHELAGIASQLPRLRALGLFAGGEYPWSVYINDLRVIAETSENAAVFLHYLTWRGRLPLGDGVDVFDEIDLWSSYLMAERFGALHDLGHVLVGNASTHFDDYYHGLAGLGPERDAPTKLLPDVVRTFVAELAERRPPGWREPAGVCLDLSIPELAFLDTKLAELAMDATAGDPVGLTAGRLALVGLPPSVNASMALASIDAEGDPTFIVGCALDPAGKPRIVWAQYRKAVTFELSEFERQVAGPRLQREPPKRSRRARSRSRGSR